MSSISAASSLSTYALQQAQTVAPAAVQQRGRDSDGDNDGSSSGAPASTSQAGRLNVVA